MKKVNMEQLETAAQLLAKELHSYSGGNRRVVIIVEGSNDDCKGTILESYCSVFYHPEESQSESDIYVKLSPAMFLSNKSEEQIETIWRDTGYVELAHQLRIEQFGEPTISHSTTQETDVPITPPAECKSAQHQEKPELLAELDKFVTFVYYGKPGSENIDAWKRELAILIKKIPALTEGSPMQPVVDRINKLASDLDAVNTTCRRLPGCIYSSDGSHDDDCPQNGHGSFVHHQRLWVFEQKCQIKQLSLPPSIQETKVVSTPPAATSKLLAELDKFHGFVYDHYVINSWKEELARIIKNMPVVAVGSPMRKVADRLNALAADLGPVNYDCMGCPTAYRPGDRGSRISYVKHHDACHRNDNNDYYHYTKRKAVREEISAIKRLLTSALEQS